MICAKGTWVSRFLKYKQKNFLDKNSRMRSIKMEEKWEKANLKELEASTISYFA